MQSNTLKANLGKTEILLPHLRDTSKFVKISTYTKAAWKHVCASYISGISNLRSLRTENGWFSTLPLTGSQV
uniref:Uncharacterized protein n=1 Tax=Anguilla anguilla TaxID=7936 RepID=A0A0E9XK43_ANGAN